MQRILTFAKDTFHLWILLVLIAAAGAGFLWARNEMHPASFGDLGPFRADALKELASKSKVLPSDATCLECHSEVGDERAGTLHEAVRCYHCHGGAADHIAEANDSSPLPAKKWDGKWRSTTSLFITKDLATCLVCHESQIGMPKDFKKINVAEHLEEMGAEEPESRATCFECHGPHDTAS
ncbi:MAG: hypothetical protein QF805_25585 [Pirellulaceae bacterium]|jgi:hypothetical protein|nr:hypothetical protein [Pirellulaceae bacterium]